MGESMIGTARTITETFGVETTPGDPTTLVPADPTTVTFNVRSPLGILTSYVFGVDAELTRASAGVYELEIVPDVAGEWLYEAVGTGAVNARSETGTFTALDSGVSPTTPPPPLDGPCSPWIDGQDVAECCATGVGTFTSLLDDSARVAEAVLYQLSGSQYPGLCTKTVRPCSTRCGCVPSGSWRWGGSRWDCGGTSCGCSPLSRVRLAGYPVRSIAEVKIDGDIVDPEGYRLDENRWLTRLRDADGTVQHWPGCQQLDLDDTEDGTFSVRYFYGRDAPVDARRAAAELACQVFLACAGDAAADGEAECVLPSNVTRITRQGITYDLAAFTAWGRDPVSGAWTTGLALVDLFLSTRNPQALRRGPAIFSPDVAGYARPVG